MKLILFAILTALLWSCSSQNPVSNAGVRSEKGYVLFLEKGNYWFFPSRSAPTNDYVQNLKSDNLKPGILFSSNCLIGDMVKNFKVDTIFNESETMKDYTPFMRYFKLFPATIVLADTSANEGEIRPLRFVFKGNTVRCTYHRLQGAIIDMKTPF